MEYPKERPEVGTATAPETPRSPAAQTNPDSSQANWQAGNQISEVGPLLREFAIHIGTIKRKQQKNNERNFNKRGRQITGRTPIRSADSAEGADAVLSEWAQFDDAIRQSCASSATRPSLPPRSRIFRPGAFGKLANHSYANGKQIVHPTLPSSPPRSDSLDSLQFLPAELGEPPVCLVWKTVAVQWRQLVGKEKRVGLMPSNWPARMQITFCR